MAVPSKPTDRLTIDGVIGQKTRDAAAYAMSVNKFTNGSDVGTIGPSLFRKNLQRWLNSEGYWRNLTEDDLAPEWQNSLRVDGNWGMQTNNKLGGAIAWLSGPHGGNRIRATDAGAIGSDSKAFQTLLNGIIFRGAPTGRGCYTNQALIKLYTSGTTSWGRTPRARWTGDGAQ